MEHEATDAFNDGFVQMMYESWLSNPASVSDEWQQMFANGNPAGASASAATTPAPTATATAAKPAAPTGGNGSAPAAARKAELPPAAQLMKGPAAGLVRNMNESLTVPVATTIRTVAVATLDARRRELNAALAGQGRKVSFTHLVAWALVRAWREFPVMGHTFETINNKPYRIANEHVNFGLAVDVEKPDGSRGLMVPVVKDADLLDARGFMDRYDELVKVTRAGKLALDDMMGTTLTLTNPGGLGTEASVPRLMAHQGTIIATGSIAFPVEFRHLPADRIAELGVSKVMTITSTYDHRVIQGAESGSFLRMVDEQLQGGHDFYDEVFAALGAGTPAAAIAAPAAPAAPAAKAAPAAVQAPAGPAVSPVEVPATLPTAAAAPIATGFDTPDPTLITASEDQLASVAAAMALVKAYRTHGHLAATLDPLGTPPIGDPSLDPKTVGLTDEIMRSIPASVLRIGVTGETLADALPRLREKYCGSIAYEIEHISDHEQRTWLRRMIESGEHRRPMSSEDRLSLLDRLTKVEAFERFVRRAYLTQKQFSIEGVDMLVPMLDEVVRQSAEQGAREVVMGMAHRGRLNVLTHIFGRPYDTVLREFEAESRVVQGTLVSGGGTGDVKYHQGANGQVTTTAGDINVVLMSNPSHLEIVNPVVEGRTRAVQTERRGRELVHNGAAAVPVLIHGDAAFAGQGISQETLNLHALVGYSTGGTVHIIANNQLGFTAEPSEGRSTRYASDLAKGFDLPIIHVNADDPEACLDAVHLGMAFRQHFGRDVMIDLIGYRRHGHNETDEPAYTQPLIYELIKKKPRVRELYAQALELADVVNAERVTALYDERYAEIRDIHEAKVLKLGDREPSELDAPTGDIIDLVPSEEPATVLTEDQIRALARELHTVPDSFTVHPKLLRQLDKRAQMPDAKFDFGAAEAIALGSLLMTGTSVRLAGQDTGRGTFSHRQMLLHDVHTGEVFAPIQHLPGAAGTLELINSPLSEEGCLAFEYGYAIAEQDSLVMWEAQFGDFVNGAQVVSDQFITSGMAKWGYTSRLTLLLPHGYEGSGPEHSNARLATWLNGAAEGNVRIANCTTAAQYFHLLRRQALITRRRPLIIMTPKGLLRAPYATSPMSELTSGRFEWVLDDPTIETAAQRETVTRLVLSSGKVYYDMANYAGRADVPGTALGRIELLYPFPRKQVADLIALYPNLTELVWAQEEPVNYGAYPYMAERLRDIVPPSVTFSYAGRPKRSAPSEGYTSVHLVEQERIVRSALGIDR